MSSFLMVYWEDSNFEAGGKSKIKNVVRLGFESCVWFWVVGFVVFPTAHYPQQELIMDL